MAVVEMWTTGDVITQEKIRATTMFRESFRGLVMRTSPDYDDRQSKIVIQALQEVCFDSGYRYAPTAASFPKTIDITASGANGLDQGSEAASTWYQILLARKASDGTLAGLLHKANRLIYTEQLTTDNTSALRDAAGRERQAQSVSGLTAGTLRFVLFKLAKVGTPSGNIWLELQADSAGSPSGTALATSRKWQVSDLSTTPKMIPFLFFGTQAYALAGSTTYWLVLKGDYSVSGANYVTIDRNSGGGYAGGSIKSFDGAAWNAGTGDFVFAMLHEVDDAAISAPSGYDQFCTLGYAYNDGSSNLQPFLHVNGWTHNLFSGAVLGAKAGITDTTNIGQVVYDTTQIPPVALCEVIGNVFNQGSAGATLAMGALDAGINFSGASGRGDQFYRQAGSGADEYAMWTGVPFMWQAAQQFRTGINNQNLNPRAWRIP